MKQPTISFFHECNPPKSTAQQRRHTKGGKTYQPENVRRAGAIYQAIFEKYRPGVPMTGPLAVTILWTWRGKRGYKVTRPDLDNLAKLVLDAGTKAGFWLDDSQVADLHLVKFIGDITGIAVTVEEAVL